MPTLEELKRYSADLDVEFAKLDRVDRHTFVRDASKAEHELLRRHLRSCWMLVERVTARSAEEVTRLTLERP